MKVELRDCTRRVIYRCKFNVRDKNQILSLLEIIELYSGHSIQQLIKEKLNIGQWG